MPSAEVSDKAARLHWMAASRGEAWLLSHVLALHMQVTSRPVPSTFRAGVLIVKDLPHIAHLHSSHDLSIFSYMLFLFDIQCRPSSYDCFPSSSVSIHSSSGSIRFVSHSNRAPDSFSTFFDNLEATFLYFHKLLAIELLHANGFTGATNATFISKLCAQS